MSVPVCIGLHSGSTAHQLADEVGVIEQGQGAALELPPRGVHRVDFRLAGPRPLDDGHASLPERLADGLGGVLVDDDRGPVVPFLSPRSEGLRAPVGPDRLAYAGGDVILESACRSHRLRRA